MAHKKLQVIGRKAQWATQFKVEALRGSPLHVSGAIATRYYDSIAKLIDRMERETVREVRALYGAFAMDGADGYAFAEDASIASQARILANALRKKWTKVFADMAPKWAEAMAEQTGRSSAQTLGVSLKEMSGQYTLKTDVLNDDLREVLTATVAENVALIKRVPATYLDNVQGSVMRSIQTGRGLADLQPDLDKYGVQIRNWSKNVALDQTRKAYNGLNAGRMRALGVNKFEWVHSGGSNHPREFHRDELDGKIFELDDPPIIDKRTGERGLPGQLPYCRCTMRPIFEFDDEDKD